MKNTRVLCRVFRRSVVEMPNMHTMIIPGRKRAVKPQAAQPLGPTPYPLGGGGGRGIVNRVAHRLPYVR